MSDEKKKKKNFFMEMLDAFGLSCAILFALMAACVV